MIDVAKQIEEVMGKAQEFASTWASVDGPFDDGSTMQRANESKAELRGMIAALLSSAQSGEQAPYAVLTRKIGESDFFDHKPVKPNSVHHLHAKQSPHYDYVELYSHPAPALEVERKELDQDVIDELAEKHGLDFMEYTPFARDLEAAIAASKPNGEAA